MAGSIGVGVGISIGVGIGIGIGIGECSRGYRDPLVLVLKLVLMLELVLMLLYQRGLRVICKKSQWRPGRRPVGVAVGEGAGAAGSRIVQRSPDPSREWPD